MSEPETPKADAPAFTPRELRDAFGLFPTGIAVITATTPDGVKLGTTVSSFNSVSLDPALVMFSLVRNPGLPAWQSCTHFAVNVLAENQSQLSTRFAKSMTDKWDGVDPLPGKATNAPLLRDALVHFECKTWAHYDGGDHLIFIGQVLAVAKSDIARPRPILFALGKYRQLDTETAIDTPQDSSIWLHGW